MAKVSSFINGEIILHVNHDEFNFIRQVVNGYCINTPKIAWATYSGFDENEINKFLDEMREEADKFDIEL